MNIYLLRRTDGPRRRTIIIAAESHDQASRDADGYKRAGDLHVKLLGRADPTIRAGVLFEGREL